MFDREKLTYELALRYAGAKCASALKKTDDPNEVCKSMIEDFAIAYKAMSDLDNKTFSFLLHEDE